MNINREHKIIWWAPERCGTKITAEIFKMFNFEVYNPQKNTFQPLKETYHSHAIELHPNFADYRVISNIRNPYDRILSFYLNFTSVGKNFVYTKNRKHKLQERLDYFIVELFQYALNENKIQNLERKIPIKEYVRTLNFDNCIPTKFIRMENLIEDFSKIDFIVDSHFWKSGQIHEMVEKNNFLNQRPFKFSEIYSPKLAFKVFDYYRKHFFICDYDPYSFTLKTLTNEEKFNFVHGIF